MTESQSRIQSEKELLESTRRLEKIAKKTGKKTRTVKPDAPIYLNR